MINFIEYKNLPSNFWDKVYIDSENLFKYLKLNNINVDNPIQFWCSDMWALLWNIIFFNKTPIIDNQLDFCFATDKYDKIALRYTDEKDMDMHVSMPAAYDRMCRIQCRLSADDCRQSE